MKFTEIPTRTSGKAHYDSEILSQNPPLEKGPNKKNIKIEFIRWNMN